MKKTILIAAVMFFAFSVAASAQALFTVGSTPTTTVTSCGTTEIAGDVVFSTVPSSLPVITGTLTINYGVPISSLSSIVVEVTTGILTGTQTTFNLTSGWSFTGSTLTITLPSGWPNGVMIRVRGVRVNVSGAPNLSNLLATVSSTVNSLTSGELSVVVISSISPAISATAVGSTNVINSVYGTTSGAAASATVNEGYVNGFVLGIGIQFNFTALPSGITFTFPATTGYGTGGVFTLVNQNLASTATPKSVFASTDGAFSVIYRLTTLSTSPAPEVTSESLTLTPTVGITTPVTPGDVNFTAQVVQFSPSTTVPNYLAGGCVTGSGKVLSVVPANTVLLVPYATAGGLYDTGLAIANTTTDPAAIASNVKKQDGSITFYFYPQTGTAFQYPAAGGTLNKGTGLTAGVLKTGGLYTVLLSELLSAAGQPAAFSGYIFAVINATNAHGQYFISDFKFFTNGALMLVVNPSSRYVVNVPEALMH